MLSYKALVSSNMKVFFSASSDVEAKVIAKKIGAHKLIKQVSPTRMEYMS